MYLSLGFAKHKVYAELNSKWFVIYFKISEFEIGIHKKGIRNIDSFLNCLVNKTNSIFNFTFSYKYFKYNLITFNLKIINHLIIIVMFIYKASVLIIFYCSIVYLFLQ